MSEDINSAAGGLIDRGQDHKTHTQRLSATIDQAYEAYRAGNSAGSTELYEALIAQALNVVWFKLPELRSIPARELAHDIATRAFEKIDQFRGESKFSTWFYAIAQREVDRALSEHITERKTLVSIDVKNDDGEDARVASADEPEAPPLPGQDAAIQLDVLMREVSEAEAAVMRSHLEGYALEETAEKSGNPLGTTRSRFERAKRKMRTRKRRPKQK